MHIYTAHMYMQLYTYIIHIYTYIYTLYQILYHYIEYIICGYLKLFD